MSSDSATASLYVRDDTTTKRHGRLSWWPRSRLFGWCSRIDVVRAFRAVNQEIDLKFERLEVQTITLPEAYRFARRIKEQRDLIRQITDRRNWRHVRRLVRLNRRHRERLLRLAQEAGLDTSVLLLK